MLKMNTSFNVSVEQIEEDDDCYDLETIEIWFGTNIVLHFNDEEELDIWFEELQETITQAKAELEEERK